MPNSTTLIQALLAAFCAILCALSSLGGGGMIIGARNGAWSGAPLPYLRRVAYLESHGHQWLDFGIVGNGNMTAEFDAQITQWDNTVNSSGRFFGARTSYNKRALLFSFSVDGFLRENTALYFNFDSQYYNSLRNDLNRHSYVFGKRGISIDGTVHHTPFAGQFTTEKNLTLFTGNYVSNGVSVLQTFAKCFSFKLDEDGVLLFDMIPVLDLSGRPAMYDEVSGQFFYNQGTGEFTWGEL